MGGDGSIPPDRLRTLVLQPEDVPEGFQRFDEGRIAATDLPPGARRDPARFGRTGGWKARYRGTAGGVLLIESRIDAFADADGAEQDLDAYAGELRTDQADIGDAGASRRPGRRRNRAPSASRPSPGATAGSRRRCWSRASRTPSAPSRCSRSRAGRRSGSSARRGSAPEPRIARECTCRE
jgi:hypothetical protein